MPGRVVIEAGHLALPGGWVRGAGALLIEEGVIRAIGSRDALAGVEADARLGDARCLALPGLVNAHQHGRGGSTVALGVPDAPLERWLIGLLALPPGDPYADTSALCRRAAVAGVTVAAHSHTTAQTTPAGYEAELRAILAAYRDAGVRGVVAADTRDRGVPVYGDEDGFWSTVAADVRARRSELGGALPPLAARLEVIATLRAEASAGRLGDVAVIYGPPGPPWCSDAALRAVARAAAVADAPVHTHLHETGTEAGFGRWAYGESTVAALHRFGLLGPRLSVAHGVHLDAQERGALADAGTSVVTNPGSNLRLHAGVAPVRALLDAGVNVAIGTDNMALGDEEELLDELRLLRALQRRPELDDPGLAPEELLAIATVNGARALGQPDAGELREGARGDVVLVELDGAEGMDPLELALATARPRHLRAVVGGGRVLAERGAARSPAPSPPAPLERRAELEGVIAELTDRAGPHYRALLALAPGTRS
jgi:5-methylthioadenosine/S-adenosylhomocysteine deaminase